MIFHWLIATAQAQVSFKPSGIIPGVLACGDIGPSYLACYIGALYNFFIQFAIVLAVLMILIGGFQWLMAIGNPGKISNAKSTINGAVIGLVLALISYLLLTQINRNLVNLQSLNIEKITGIPALNTTTVPGVSSGDCPAPTSANRIDTFAANNINRAQLNYGSVELVESLRQLRSMIDKDGNFMPVINSINDDNIFAGSCYRKPDLTIDPYDTINKTGCQHNDSWHYGVGKCIFTSAKPPLSCAVDLKLIGAAASYYPTLYKYMYDAHFAMAQCENNRGVVDCKTGNPDHIHGQVDCRSVVQPAPGQYNPFEPKI